MLVLMQARRRKENLLEAMELFFERYYYKLGTIINSIFIYQLRTYVNAFLLSPITGLTDLLVMHTMVERLCGHAMHAMNLIWY